MKKITHRDEFIMVNFNYKGLMCIEFSDYIVILTALLENISQISIVTVETEISSFNSQVFFCTFVRLQGEISTFIPTLNLIVWY